MPAILVADDHGANLQPWLGDMLRGYPLVFETQGYKAISVLDSRADIGAVLLDLRFDDQPKQGHEIVHDINKKHPSIPVIILTVETDVELAQTLKEQGLILYYFVKERLDRSRFTQKIADAIESWERLRSIDALRLEIRDAECRASIGDVSLPLTKMQFSLYRTVVQAAVEQWSGVGPDGFGGSGWLAFSDFYDIRTKAAQHFLEVYEASLAHAIDGPDELRLWMQEAVDPKKTAGFRDGRRQDIRRRLSPCLSHINQELDKALGDEKVADIFKISKEPRRRNRIAVSTFGITLQPSKIIIV